MHIKIWNVIDCLSTARAVGRLVRDLDTAECEDQKKEKEGKEEKAGKLSNRRVCHRCKIVNYSTKAQHYSTDCRTCNSSTSKPCKAWTHAA